VRGTIPNRSTSNGQSVRFIDRIFVNGVADDAMPARFQQGCLVGEDLILPAGLLIEIVNDDDGYGKRLFFQTRLLRNGPSWT